MCVCFGSSYKYSKKMFHSVQHDNWIIFSIFAPYMNKNRQIDIMGIVNLTDDSYFSASRCASPSQAVALASRLVDEGASILDFGACSTRPGAEAVGAEEEWRRLRPALEAVRKEFPDVRISVDTYWSDVVRRAYDAIGDFIVNDISAGEDDPQMLPLVGRLGLTYVAMHKRGTPQTMQSMTDYEDVTSEVADYFSDFSKILQNSLLFSRFLKICLGKTLYISFLFNDAPNGGGKLIDVAFGIKNAEADTGGTAVGCAQRGVWARSAMVSRAKAEALFR
jgi:hypothetical protein